MPLYEYRCGDCGREFEDISSYEDRDNKRSCPSCTKENIQRKISSFGINSGIDSSSTVYSPKEIDHVVGAAADKRWETYHAGWKNTYEARRRERLAGKEVSEVVIGKGSDGVVRPFEHLGDKKEQAFRKDYSREYKKQIVDTGKDGDKTPVVMQVK